MGKSKENLDRMDINLCVLPVVEMFGRNPKYLHESSTLRPVTSSVPNAFQLMMMTQHSLQMSTN